MLTSSSWIVSNEFQNTEAARAFASIDQVFSLSGQRITADKISNVHRVEIKGTAYYVKRYTQAGKGLRQYFGRSRIRAEWENMLFFHQLGVPAAPVVAYGEEKKWGAMTRGALITKEVENTKDLRAMVHENSDFLQDRSWVAKVISQVAQATRSLHQNSFIHIDLKWRNILVTQEQEPRIALIDCPAGMKQPSWLLKRNIIKDLACLDKVAKYTLSNTQRLSVL